MRFDGQVVDQADRPDLGRDEQPKLAGERGRGLEGDRVHHHCIVQLARGSAATTAAIAVSTSAVPSLAGVDGRSARARAP